MPEINDILFTSAAHGFAGHCLMAVTRIGRHAIHCQLWSPDGVTTSPATPDTFTVCGRLPLETRDPVEAYTRRRHSLTASVGDVILTELTGNHPLNHCLMVVAERDANSLLAWMRTPEREYPLRAQPGEYILCGRLTQDDLDALLQRAA